MSDIRPEAQAFDEIRIKTVPRYKQSGMSGDEWRISATVELMRNDIVVHTESYRNVETATRFLPALHATAIDEGHGYFASENSWCDQEGCSDFATVYYNKKLHYSREGYSKTAPEGTTRQFCEKHKTRGDCGLDDADRNYELI